MSKNVNIVKEIRGRARKAIGSVPQTRRVGETRDAKINRVQREEAEQEILDSLDGRGGLLIEAEPTPSQDDF